MQLRLTASPRRPLSIGSVLIMLAAMALGGCSADTIAGNVPLGDPAPAKSNTLTFVSVDHDIHFSPASRQLAPSEERSLADFVKASGVTEDDDVTIGLSAGDSASVAAARRASVLAVLARLHVKATPASDPALGANAIRLRVARYSVTPPHCPDWTKPETDEPTNTPSSNFGCATQSSLALMVANPRDLVHGTPAGPADGEALIRGVGLYRSGALSKSMSSSANGASAAGVGGTTTSGVAQ